MVTEAPTLRSRFPVERGTQSPPAQARTARAPAPRVIAFTTALALVLVYALRGGAYDLVAFEEYGLVIWVVLGAGISLGLLPRTRPSRPVLMLLGALLAYAAWIAISLLWSESAERTVTELARALDYLGLVALVSTLVDQRTWRAAAAGLGAGAMLVCVLSVASRFVPGAFPATAVSASAHFYRLSYPFGYWNAVGAWGAMCVATALALSAHAQRRIVRALALAGVPIAFLATYLSYSRAGLIGTGVAVLAVLVLSRSRITAAVNAAVAAGGGAIAVLAVRGAPEIANASGTRGAGGAALGVLAGIVICAGGAVAASALRLDRRAVPRAVARPLLAAGLLILLVAGAGLGPRLTSRAWHSFTRPNVVTATADPTQRLVNLSGSRYYVWQAALKAFGTHPLGGTGAGTFEFWWNRHATDPEFALNAHSLWVQNLAELGVPGLLLVIAVAVAALITAGSARRHARRRASAGASAGLLALLIVYLVHASVDWMWESTAVTMLALCAAAVLSGRLGTRARSLRWFARAPLTAIAVVAAVVQVPGLLSTAELRRSQSEERGGHSALALSWADAAVSAEPWSASAYEQRGLVLEAAGRYADAARDVHRAIAHEPMNYVHWAVLARIEAERGRVDVAVQDLSEARLLRPHALLFSGYVPSPVPASPPS